MGVILGHNWGKTDKIGIKEGIKMPDRMCKHQGSTEKHKDHERKSSPACELRWESVQSVSDSDSISQQTSYLGTRV